MTSAVIQPVPFSAAAPASLPGEGRQVCLGHQEEIKFFRWRGKGLVQILISLGSYSLAGPTEDLLNRGTCPLTRSPGGSYVCWSLRNSDLGGDVSLTSFKLSFSKGCEIGLKIFQKRKLRFREVQLFVQGHRDDK